MIKPVYNLLRSVLRNKTLSAVLSEFLFFGLIIFCAVFIVNSLLSQISELSSPFLARNIFSLENQTLFNFNLSNIDFDNPLTKETISAVGSNLQQIALKTPLFMINMFLLTYITYFFVKDSKGIKNNVLKMIPAGQKENLNNFIRKVDLLTKEIIYGYFLAAIFVGLLTFVLLTLLGVTYSFDYALFSGLSSLIPVIGNWIVPLFLASYYFINKNYLISIVLTAFAFLTSSLIGMFRPIVSRNLNNIHPLIFIIGVVVGFYSFGLFGFLIGPVLFGIVQIGFQELFRNF